MTYHISYFNSYFTALKSYSNIFWKYKHLFYVDNNIVNIQLFSDLFVSVPKLPNPKNENRVLSSDDFVLLIQLSDSHKAMNTNENKKNNFNGIKPVATCVKFSLG